MIKHTDQPPTAASPTAREARIAEETVSAIDFMSRLLGAIETGRWTYALDKLGQLQRPLKSLGVYLAQDDQTAKGARVDALVRREARHYRIGKALYGDSSAAAEQSPLAQADDAKRRRDFFGEIDAIQAGHQALESAPWYPALVGDVVHVFYYGSFTPAMPPQGETYVVEHSEEEGGLVLRLLYADVDLIGPGAFAPGMAGDPLMEAWMEAGPAALTIVRAGRVIHGSGAPR